MTIIRLVYASSAAESTSLDDVKAIVRSAGSKNYKGHITGFMCASSDYFLQCLEGEADQVDRLYEKISEDGRHHSLTLLSREEVDTYSFKDWSMGCVLLIERHKDILAKHGVMGVFNPYELTESESLALLSDFSKLRHGQYD